MLDDLLAEELLGDKALASAASAWLTAAAAPSGILVAEGAPSLPRARAGMERALAALASGSCLALAVPAGGRASFAEAIEAYRGRALVRLYGGEGSAAAIAAGMARDLAAGGDGTGPVRLADGLAAARPADLERVVRDYLDPRRLSWSFVVSKAELSGAGSAP
jgi:predicted Zn-dependent peptidase